MFELAPLPGDDWLTLFEAEGERPAVRVRMAPIGPSVLRSAQLALQNAAHPIKAYAQDAGFDAFSRELCRRSLLEWEGIHQHGAPAPLTAETADQLLANIQILARLQSAFVYPFLERQAEKNVSSPSSAGITPATTGAKATARGAKRSAKPVPTSSTSPKAVKAKPAGR